MAAIDADVNHLDDDAFAWMGMSMPDAHKTGTPWRQHFAATVYNPETMRVNGDINGDGTADFSIDVQNVAALDALTFIL